MKALLPAYGGSKAQNTLDYLASLRDSVIPDEWETQGGNTRYQPPVVSTAAVAGSAASSALTTSLSLSLPGILLGALAGHYYKSWDWKKGAVVGGVAALVVGSTVGAATGVVAATERKAWG
jgi:hypothetical protein